MPASLRLAACACVAGAVVACGGGSSPSSAIANLSPQDIIKASAQQAQQNSLRFDLSAKFGIDTSHLVNANSNLLGPLAGGIQLTGHGDQESAQRERVTMLLAPLLTQQIVAVLYDGTSYVSLDGSRFAQYGSLRQLTGGFGTTPSDLKDYLGSLASVSDMGTTQIDGMTVEHLRAGIDKSYIDRALAGSQAQQLRRFIDFQGGTVDAYVVPQTGRLDRVNAHLGLSFNLSALFGAIGGQAPPTQLPSGSLGVAVDYSVHLFDYGAKITVTKPTVDPNAPKVPSGGLFGSLTG